MFRSVHQDFYGDEHTRRIIDDIRRGLVCHPATTFVDTKSQVCFNDEQWKVHKNMLARIAKERKVKKTIVQKRQVRNQRDESFEQIELRDDRPVYRICDTTFAMKKYKNLKDVDGNPVELAQILKTLHGDLDRYDGYFWIQM
jgi:hypothetical protein